ncbi:MAG: hypothetical protein H7222_17650 [Methylotenera sp.]|nr:hypothetical protein [Oligoflexia bacterium]
MLKTFKGALALTAALASFSTVALAEDYSSMDSNTDTSGTTTKDVGNYNGDSMLKREVVGIKPQVGALSTSDRSQDSRLAYGFTADLNLASSIWKAGSKMRNVFFGPSTGVLYSNRGAAGSNFFASSDISGDSAKLMLIPANLKLGYNITPSFRVSAHGGGNFVYRNNPGAVQLGNLTSTSNGADWTLRPNVGADFEFGLGQNFGLIIRPDVTLNPGNDLYSATIGFNALIG